MFANYKNKFEDEKATNWKPKHLLIEHQRLKQMEK